MKPFKIVIYTDREGEVDSILDACDNNKNSDVDVYKLFMEYKEITYSRPNKERLAHQNRLLVEDFSRQNEITSPKEKMNYLETKEFQGEGIGEAISDFQEEINNLTKIKEKISPPTTKLRETVADKLKRIAKEHKNE